MKKYEWWEDIEDEDGTVSGRRYVRASYHGPRWKLQEMRPGDEDWIDMDPMPLVDLMSLRDLVWRKYQRRRARFQDIRAVDEFITAAGGDPTGLPGFTKKGASGS